MSIKTNWNINERHTLGQSATTSSRIVLGDNERIGGVAKVEYKAVGHTDASAPSWKNIKTDYTKV